jgi:RsiW-degrading membrane proteinase PrsW (M82 family)
MLACAICLGVLVYRYDLYEREPWFMLLLAAGLGVLGCWSIGYVEDYALERLPGGETILIQAAVAGILEELVKLTAVLLIAQLVRSQFNDPFDGLIYGAFAGLGFGVWESLFYIKLMPAAPLWMISGQEAVRLLLHLLLGALTCCGLGLARFRVPHWPWLLAGWCSAAMAIHFLWDFTCGLPSRYEEGAAHQRTIAILLMMTATVLFGITVVFGARHSRRVHASRLDRRLWGWPFSLLFKARD